jgi:hypothetical protein
VATFLTFIRQSGPKWDPSSPLEGQSDWSAHAQYMDELVDTGFIVLGGPISGRRVVHVIEADSEDEIRSTLARDPWSESHLQIESIELWNVRLDGRNK